jgi:methyl-CpG-binding domain protein 4
MKKKKNREHGKQLQIHHVDGVIIQETLKREPWKMLVACILLNLTNRRQVDQIIDRLFERFGFPSSMAMADEKEIAAIIKPCGMQHKKARCLKKFSWEFWHREWTEPIELFGIGRYAADSWEIFVRGNLNFKPQDKELKKYVEAKLENSK